MVRTRHSTQTLAGWLRTYWIGLVMMVIVILALAAGRAVAAPPAQNGTVPPPTPRPTATQIPRATATATRDNDEDNDDDSNDQSSPTNTPTVRPTASAQTGQQTQNAPTGVINVSRLNVRSGPGTNFGVVGVAVNGETIRIFERNTDGSWLHICCATTTGAEGWVSAQFVRLNLEDAQIATAIPLAGSGTGAAQAAAAAATSATTNPLTRTATTTITGAAMAPITTTAAVTSTQAISGAPELLLAIEQDPPFAWQGQEVLLTFTITNRGEGTATNVELRNEVPAELRFVEGEASSNATLAEEELAEGRLAFVIAWPTMAPGDTQTATVRVQIQAGLPDGSVIDNLAVVSAKGVEPFTNGISIGLPPTSPPTFQ